MVTNPASSLWRRPPIDPALARANASRLRAWEELRKLRRVLSLVAKLEGPPRPKNFEKEGAIIRDALITTLRNQLRTIEELLAAVEKMRPYLAQPAPEGTDYPSVLPDLNRAVQKAMQAGGEEIIRCLGQKEW